MLDYISVVVPSVIVYLSFFFSVVLWLSSEEETHKTILALLTLTIGCNFVNVLLLNQEIVEPTWNLGAVFGLLYGPLIYFFVQSMMYRQSITSVKKWVHFLPSLAGLLVTIPLVRIDYFTFSQFAGPVVIAHMSSYLYLSLRAAREYEDMLKEQFSSVVDYDLKWIRNLIVICMLVIAALLAESLVQGIREEWTSALVFSGALFLVSYLYYKSINQSLLLLMKKEKYEKSTLSGDEVSALFQQLQEVMQTKKPYLNAELTLNELAEAVGEKPRHISRVINENARKNFYEYVNAYRVERAKNLLLDPETERDRIGEIMYDSGFNSKSTFNMVFKKVTGVTPSNFKRQKGPSA